MQDTQLGVTERGLNPSYPAAELTLLAAVHCFLPTWMSSPVSWRCDDLQSACLTASLCLGDFGNVKGLYIRIIAPDKSGLCGCWPAAAGRSWIPQPHPTSSPGWSSFKDWYSEQPKKGRINGVTGSVFNENRLETAIKRTK